MKKYLIVCLLCLPCMLSAQNHYGTIKAGLFAPAATEVGIILEYQWGWQIDNNVSFGWSAGWFNKNYIDKNYIRQLDEFYGPINSSLNELRAKTNLHSIPVMAVIEGNWPIARRTRFFFTGGLGAEALLIFYRNYSNPDDSNLKAAFDFCWRFGGGIMYELGKKSDLTFELLYHSSKPGWQYNVEENGRRRVFERTFDMSGLMIRAGIRFYY